MFLTNTSNTFQFIEIVFVIVCVCVCVCVCVSLKRIRLDFWETKSRLKGGPNGG